MQSPKSQCSLDQPCSVCLDVPKQITRRSWLSIQAYQDLDLFIPFSHLPRFFCCCFLVFVFLGPHLWQMEVPRLGGNSELQLLTYTTADGKTRSLTHWARPWIEPTTSWLLVRFISTVPQWELLLFKQNKTKQKKKKPTIIFTYQFWRKRLSFSEDDF